MIGALGFAASLALASGTVRKLAPSFAPDPSHDPLHLDMPTFAGPGGSEVPAASSLDLFGALYLQAEMEQAGVIPVVEALADQRATMPIMSDEAAGRLEKFATNMRDRWHDRAYRNQIFARLFGLGDGATSDQGALVNHDFLRILAALCNAMVQYASPNPWNQSALSSQAAFHEEGQELLLNLGQRQFGNALLAASSIQEELQQAINTLNDPGIQQTFQAHGLWDTLQKILGPNAPDVSRMIHRGQCGQAILHWLSLHSADFGEGGTTSLTPQDSVILAAAQWLQATGMPAPATTPPPAGAA